MLIEIKKDTPRIPYRNHWQFCVGSPHATYALRRDYYEQLKQVHEELGIQRVRFHGIFDDDMHTLHKAADIMPVPGSKLYSEQSFRWCAAAYDNVLAAGMKPFVELSFMPSHLAAKKKKGMFFYKPNISPPKDYDRWYDYIQSFIRFLIDRYGLEEVRQWYFEVWNEPDLQMPFFAGTQKDYFKLYETTVRAIKEIDEQLIVGGPATSCSRWIQDMVAYCKENQVPIDFVSTHEYAGDPLGGIDGGGEVEKVAVKADLMAGFKKRKQLPHDAILPAFRQIMDAENVTKNLRRSALINCSKRVKEEAGDLPVYYTEWNMCGTFSAPCNDTRMQAAYILQAVLGTQDTIQGSSIWCFTDLFEELHPFPEEFHGGFGMMTQSGIKKPTYHLLQLLGKVAAQRYDIPINQDGVDVAVFCGDNSTHVLLSKLNFQPSGEIRTVTVRLPLEADPGEVALLRIDEDHGNPLKCWCELGAPQVPNPTQIRKIKEKSALCPEQIPYSISDGTMEFSVNIGENDICYIEIKH